MIRRAIFLILVFGFSVIILNGCSGGSPKQGTFSGPVVEGLEYSGQWSSGKTDAEGGFRYRKGDVLTFSLGGVVLGCAEAKDIITPFDLCGLDPILDQKSLQASAKISPSSAVTRLINILVLLQSLDQGDEDAIVISDELRVLVLKGAFNLTLSSDEFNLQLRDFYLKARAAGIKTGFVTPETAVGKLFDGIDSEPVYKQIKRISIDNDGDEIEDNYIAFEYNASGKLTSKVQNLVGFRSTETWEYDDKLQMTSAVAEQVLEREGSETTYTSSLANTYDDAGRLTQSISVRTEGEQRRTETLTIGYDEEDRVVLREREGAAGDATISRTESIVYNEHGNWESMQLQSVSTRGDNVQTIEETIRFTYNEANLPTEEDVVAIITVNGESQTMRRNMVLAYNADGQRERQEGTYSMSGRSTGSVVEIYTYNEYGQALRADATMTETVSGNTRVEYRSYEYTYDQYGFIENRELSQESSINGVQQEWFYEAYGSNQNITRLERTLNIDKSVGPEAGDAKAPVEDINTTFSYILDHNKNVVTAIADKESDGTHDITQFFEYDDMGYIQSRQLVGEVSNSIYTYTYNEQTITAEDAHSITFDDIYLIHFDRDFYFSYDREMILQDFAL